MSHHRTVLAGYTLVAVLGGVVAACGADEPASSLGAAEDSTASAAPTPTSEPSSNPTPVGDGCGTDLVAAVHGRSPDYGEVAVDRCDGGWAYVGAEEGMGDTEQVWRVEAGAWAFVTGMPSELCPVDLEEQGAPTWVVDLFAYREYAC